MGMEALLKRRGRAKWGISKFSSAILSTTSSCLPSCPPLCSCHQPPLTSSQAREAGVVLGMKTGACFDLNLPFLISLLVQRLSTQLTYCSLLKEYPELLPPGGWSEKTCSCSLGQAAFWLALGYSRGLGGGGREATGFIGTSRSQLAG